MKVNLTKAEIRSILRDIECTIDSIRIDDDTDNITFDVTNFETKDYIKSDVELLGKLYAKLRPLLR